MEKAGVIEHRTGLVNRWLREKMDDLEAGELDTTCRPRGR
jgi:hypothetical protein